MGKKLVLQKTQGKVKGKLPVMLFEEGKQFVAYCPAIDLSACGDTEEQALKRFTEAVDIYFDELVKMGTVDDVLAECGWKKATRKSSNDECWSRPVYKQKLIPISEGAD